MERLEKLDRRAFLRGMMVTSAGLVVPKPVQVFVPNVAPLGMWMPATYPDKYREMQYMIKNSLPIVELFVKDVCWFLQAAEPEAPHV